MTQFLLCLPLQENERGTLPPIPPGAYIGFFEAAARRLVFVFDPAEGFAKLYLSSEGWDKAFLMREGRFPPEIVLDSAEAAWAVACWKTVQAQLRTKTF
jgi:hypothetical protein